MSSFEVRQNIYFCCKDTQLKFSMLLHSCVRARKECYLLGKIETVTVKNYSVQAQVSDSFTCHTQHNNFPQCNINSLF